MTKIGKQYRLNYPQAFTALPAYTAHAGQLVTILRQLGADEADIEYQPMWEVQAADGWRGYAFDDELVQS